MSYGYFIFLFPYKTRGPSACDDAEEQFSSDSSRALPSSKRLLFPQEGAQRSLHDQMDPCRLRSALRSLGGRQRGCAGQAGPNSAPHGRILSLKSQVCVCHRSLKEILYTIKILLCSMQKVSAQVQRTLQFPVEFLEMCYLSR